MAFLRKQTSEGSIGLLYSIIHKCICVEVWKKNVYIIQKYYLMKEHLILRKRLVYVTNEDIGHIKLSNEIMECKNNDLFKYLIICCRLKKTHDPAWLSRLALHYSMNNIKTDDKELIEAMKMTEFIRKNNYKNIFVNILVKNIVNYIHFLERII